MSAGKWVDNVLQVLHNFSGFASTGSINYKETVNKISRYHIVFSISPSTDISICLIYLDDLFWAHKNLKVFSLLAEPITLVAVTFFNAGNILSSELYFV